MAYFRLSWFLMKKTSSTGPSTGKNVENEENGRMQNSLHELFLDELADLLSAEQQLIKALPQMIKAAKSDGLKTAIEEHLKETEGQLERLDQVFRSLDEKAPRKTCAAMKGLIEEASELLQEQKGKPSVDAAIIAAAQKVEHYEIASYGTVRTWAELMEHDEAVNLLAQTLEEEKAADEKLTELAQSTANEEAAQ